MVQKTQVTFRISFKNLANREEINLGGPMLSNLSAADWGNCEIDVFRPVHFQPDKGRNLFLPEHFESDRILSAAETAS